jgi:ABC-2 type transport system permease protein
MLGAGANTLPAAVLFLALGALAFALVPRASTMIAYGVVGLAFVWELFGSLLEAPGWLLAVSPFHDVALVPGEPFQSGAAAIMLGLAALLSVAALWAFRRRDLIGA